MAATADFPATNDAYTPHYTPDWKRQNAYRCHVCIVQDDDDSFSAIVLNLPGAGSCGTTEEEAMQNVEEAIRGVFESYADSGDAIPWRDVTSRDIPANAKLKWILVNA